MTGKMSLLAGALAASVFLAPIGVSTATAGPTAAGPSLTRHSFNMLNGGGGAAMMIVIVTGGAIVIGGMTPTGVAAGTSVTSVLSVGVGEIGSTGTCQTSS